MKYQPNLYTDPLLIITEKRDPTTRYGWQDKYQPKIKLDMGYIPPPPDKRIDLKFQTSFDLDLGHGGLMSKSNLPEYKNPPPPPRRSKTWSDRYGEDLNEDEKFELDYFMVDYGDYTEPRIVIPSPPKSRIVNEGGDITQLLVLFGGATTLAILFSLTLSLIFE